MSPHVKFAQIRRERPQKFHRADVSCVILDSDNLAMRKAGTGCGSAAFVAADDRAVRHVPGGQAMGMSKRNRIALGGVITLIAIMIATEALAEDFFSALFGAFGVHRPMTRMPYAGEDNAAFPPDGQPRPRIYGGSQAYCVRTCDGRYFPISNTGNQSRAASCNSFCPASETKVVYGGTIDNAVTEEGKPYSELPNAFRYRDEFVAGCTCNG